MLAFLMSPQILKLEFQAQLFKLKLCLVVDSCKFLILVLKLLHVKNPSL